MIDRKSFGTSDFFNIFFKNLLHFLFLCDIIKSVPRNIRPVGQAVRLRPLTAATGVRFPYGSPKQKRQVRKYLSFLFLWIRKVGESKKAVVNDSLNGCQSRDDQSASSAATDSPTGKCTSSSYACITNKWTGNRTPVFSAPPFLGRTPSLSPVA